MLDISIHGSFHMYLRVLVKYLSSSDINLASVVGLVVPIQSIMLNPGPCVSLWVVGRFGA